MASLYSAYAEWGRILSTGCFGQARCSRCLFGHAHGLVHREYTVRADLHGGGSHIATVMGSRKFRTRRYP
jgi:hypothetical protein